MTMDTETDIVRCWLIRETAGAYLLRDRDEETREAFFPKSQVSFRYRNPRTKEATAEIPLWLLDEKGWNS